MVTQFLKDFRAGALAEQYVAWLFTRLGYSANKAGRCDSGKDLLISRGGATHLIEVKFDRMSSRTGNLAIEFWNPRSNSPSGITSTTADYWVYVLENPLVAYLVSVDSLLRFIQNTKPLKTIRKAGDGNASVYIYSLELLFPIFQAISEAQSDAIGDLSC